MSAIISIVVPCFNVADEVGDTLKSIAEQTLPDWQAILVNDGSTDATSGILRQFAAEECRARLIEQSNAGLSAARNAGVAAATCDRILFLDAGDSLEPEALATLDGLLAQHHEAGAVCGGWRFVGPNGEDQDWLGWSPKRVLSFDDFAAINPVNTDSLLIRREWLARAGEFDTTLPGCEDWDLWMRMAHAGCQFITTPDPVSRYRMAINSMSRRTDLMLDAGLRVIRKADAYRRQSSREVSSHADQHLREAESNWCAYCLACDFVQGRLQATLPLILKVADIVQLLNPRQLARQLYFAVPYVTCTFPNRWPAIWPGIKAELASWLDGIGQITRASVFAAECLAHLRQLVGNTGIAGRLLQDIETKAGGRRIVVYGCGRNGQELLLRLRRIGIQPVAVDDADGTDGIARYLECVDCQLIVVTPWENEPMCQKLVQGGARRHTHFVTWSDYAQPIDS